MFFYYENASHDPTYNLALEEYLTLHHSAMDSAFLLWQNEPSVIVGRHQNTAEEIDEHFVRNHSIHVVRRISGGGAVYHDLGNLNYSLIVNHFSKNFDFARFTEPVIRTLAALGVHAENSGRNDILVDGRKISGTARFQHKNRILHHGTILFDSDLDRLASALGVTKEIKYRSKATNSVRSRVANVSEFLDRPLKIEIFRDMLLEHMKTDNNCCAKNLDSADIEKIEKLRDEKYRSWNWNYGKSPAFERRCGVRKFDWGVLDIRIGVDGGTICSCTFYGDFFTVKDLNQLTDKFIGLRFDRSEWDRHVSQETIQAVLPNLSKADLLDMIFDVE